MVTHLIKEKGKIPGAAGFSIDEATVHIFKAKSVIFCSGADGFKPNVFPICDLTQTLQGVMIPNFILYIKKESLLKAALAYVEELRDHHMPMLRAADLHELRLAHETSNMIMNAEMKLKASLMRKESRCSHYRLDYPDPDTKNWNAWINIYKGSDGTMKLEKQAFGSWPA